jgi:hypothetical protein
MSWNISTKEMYRLVHEDYYTLREVGAMCGISSQAVSFRLIKAGYKIKKAPHVGRDLPELTVPSLLEKFLGECLTYSDASRKLKITPEVIKNWVKFHGLKWKFDRKGKAASNWVNGRHVDKKGYVWINVHECKYQDFNLDWTAHNVPEHKQIMETRILGMVIPYNYFVHHIDFNRGNNDPSNLLLLEVTQHTQYHRLLRVAEEMTAGDQQWLDTIKDMLLEVIKELHRINIRRIKLESILITKGCHDELATFSREVSLLENHPHYSADYLIARL